MVFRMDSRMVSRMEGSCMDVNGRAVVSESLGTPVVLRYHRHDMKIRTEKASLLLTIKLYS